MSGPVKRSVQIAGHATSISLEPISGTPLSEPALAVKAILMELAAGLTADPSWIPESGDTGAP